MGSSEGVLWTVPGRDDNPDAFCPWPISFLSSCPLILFASLPKLVETPGIEPGSEQVLLQTSTSLVAI